MQPEAADADKEKDKIAKPQTAEPATKPAENEKDVQKAEMPAAKPADKEKHEEAKDNKKPLASPEKMTGKLSSPAKS